jgi:hypothetical protein
MINHVAGGMNILDAWKLIYSAVEVKDYNIQNLSLLWTSMKGTLQFKFYVPTTVHNHSLV